MQQDLNISSPEINEPTHFDDLINTQETTERSTERQEVRSVLTTPDDFHKMFVAGFKIGSHMTGLKSLHTEEGGSARDASDAIYETCLTTL